MYQCRASPQTNSYEVYLRYPRCGLWGRHERWQWRTVCGESEGRAGSRPGTGRSPARGPSLSRRNLPSGQTVRRSDGGRARRKTHMRGAAGERSKTPKSRKTQTRGAAQPRRVDKAPQKLNKLLADTNTANFRPSGPCVGADQLL
jgi:hypothetical protein